MLKRLASAAALALVACGGPRPLPDVPDAQDAPSPTDTARDDATMDVPDVTPPTDASDDAPMGPTFCSLGTNVPGAVVPAGFCIRQFATVRSPRTLAFAPNGDLFVGAPSTFAPGGANGGPGAVLVYSDDDHDGVGEQHTFAGSLADVHGIALGGGYLYYTTQNSVFRTPYTTGQRAETPGSREDLRMPTRYGTAGRWTHGLARSVGGTLLTSTGQYGTCGGMPVGEISRVGTTPPMPGAMGTLDPVAVGFRNPMYLRCHFRDEVCVASELGEDQTPGAREKILVVRMGTNYGYPCCFTTNLGPGGGMNCGSVTREDMEFPIGDTPFGLDWERGVWPEPYRHALFVALHGSFYTTPAWQGARIVFASADPTTHVPSGAWRDLVTGFGPGGSPLDRPSDIAFAPDGRLFFSDDLGNAIYWVAPTSLRMPAR
jgi:glucose/arabinose dehydrogenase